MPVLDEFPLVREHMSVEWVARCLARAGMPDAAPSAIALEEVPEPGQTADVYVVRLEHERGAGEDLPRTLFVKAAPRDDRHRLAVHDLGLYARELSFYRDFGADPGIRLPTVYFANLDPDSGRFVILMEDLGPTHRQGDMWHASVEDVEVALGALADFHAHWWQHPRVRASRWLTVNDALGHFEREVAPMLPTLSGLLTRKYGSAYRDYLRYVVEHLAGGWARAWATDPIAETTLLHGDFHPKELFFRAGEVVAIDWQAVCTGSPGVDLHRIVLAGLDAHQLRQHQDRLLDLYRERLCARGIIVDPEALLADTRRSMLLAVRNWLFSVAFTDIEVLERSAGAAGTDYRTRLFEDFAGALEHNRVHAFLETA